MPDHVLDRDAVRAAVTMAAAIDGLRSGFRDLAAGAFEMPTRTALHDGAFLVMPVAHPASGTAIVKTLSLNFDRSPAISGTVTWSELSRPDTVIADAGAVTQLRTGAATGVATDLLAPAQACTLTVFGAGAQAADQVRAVHAVRPLRLVTVVARRAAQARALADLLAAELPATRVDVGVDRRSALAGADVVCCATRASAPLFGADELAPRAHVNAIGSFRPDMCELPVELLADAVVVVDERAAALAEAGEVIAAVRAGAITESAVLELGAALTTPPRAAGRTVFKSVGVAMQDWVIARLLAARVFATGEVG